MAEYDDAQHRRDCECEACDAWDKGFTVGFRRASLSSRCAACGSPTERCNDAPIKCCPDCHHPAEQFQADGWRKYRDMKATVRALLAAEERGQGVSWQEAIKRLARLVERPKGADCCSGDGFHEAWCPAKERDQ